MRLPEPKVFLAFLILGSPAMAQDARDPLPRVRGIVRADEGPVTGARVRIRTARTNDDIEYVVLPDAEIAGQTTGEDGRFDLPLGARSILTGEEYVLSVEHPEFAGIARHRITPWRLASLGPHEIELGRGFPVKGRVTGPDNRPVPGARVVLAENIPGQGTIDRWLTETTTDGDGNYAFLHSVQVDRRTILVLADGFRIRKSGIQAGASGTRHFSLQRQDRPDVFAASEEKFRRLNASRFQRIAVDAATGESIPIFAVGVAPRTGTPFVEPRDRVIFTPDGPLSARRWTVLDPSKGLFHVYADGYAAAREGLSIEGDFQPDRILVHRGAMVKGSVVDVAGHPVAGARVAAEPAPARDDPFASAGIDRSWCCFPHAFTGPDGSYSVPHVPPGRHIVRAGARGLAPAASEEIAVPPAGTVAVPSICLDSGGCIAGTIAEGYSLRIGALLVSARDGAFRVEGLPPGLYPVSFKNTGCLVHSKEAFVVRGLETRITIP